MKNKAARRLFAIALASLSILSMSGIASVRATDMEVTDERTEQTVNSGVKEDGNSQSKTEVQSKTNVQSETNVQPEEGAGTSEPLEANGFVEENEPTEDIVNEATEVSFGVISDTHVTAAKETEQARLKKAFQFYSNSGVDSLVVDGDLTDSGAESEYDTWGQIKEDNLTIPLIAAMGNHEGNSGDRFIETTGSKPNDHKIINGYHFITISPGTGTVDETTGKATSHGGTTYAYATSWLKEQMDEAYADDPEKPIFVFFHAPIKDTFYVSNEWYGSGLDEFFKDYPTAVTFSGHIHSPNNMPTSIWQDGGYTAVNTVTLSYMEMETGMIYGSVPPNASQIAQGLVVEAEGSRVTIKNYDFLAEQWIPQTWTFDVKDVLPYTNERKEHAQAPYFAEDAQISVNNVTEESAEITFTQAKVAENNVGDIVHSYRYDLIDKKTGETVKTFKTWSDYYLQPMPDTMTQEAEDLLPGTEYEVQIHAINAYQQVSENYLLANFKTEGEAEGDLTFEDMTAKLPKADLLDVDFADGEAKDKSERGHELGNSNGSNVTQDDTLGKYTATFTGKNQEAFTVPWSQEDYKKANDSFTLETVFKVDEFSDSFVDLFGNMESAGIGLEISKGSEGKANLEAWVHLNDAYKKPIAGDALTYGEWCHAAITYDGKKVTLYVNGQKAASMKANGNVKTPPVSSQYFVIGGDSGSEGGIQSPMTGAVSTARIYSEALSAKQIQMIANRDLSLIDEEKPLIQLASKPAVESMEGETYVIPAAQSADNSTVVTMKAVIEDADGNVVKTIGGETAQLEESTFLPKAGKYTLQYIATDKAGNESAESYTITVLEKEGNNQGENNNQGGTGNQGENNNQGGAGNQGENNNQGNAGNQGGNETSRPAGNETIKTGDSTPVMLWIAGAVIGLAGIVAAGYKKSRRH